MTVDGASTMRRSATPRPDGVAHEPVSVLHVNFDDLPGRRFNGIDARAALSRLGVSTKHFVAHKISDDPDVTTLENWLTKKQNKYARRLEKRLSLQAMLHATSRELMASEAFARADLIHLHIVHLNYFSLASLQRLCAARPVLWTLHDPWALTGHCVHPLDCRRWETGCGACPYLDTDLKIRRDTTAFLFRYKAWAYRHADFEMVVASPWLERMVARSPLLRDKRRHLIPFGIDMDVFRPGDAAAARDRLGVPSDRFVVCLREDGQSFKGLAQLQPALEILAERGDIRLVTLGQTDKLGPLAERFPTHRFGWVDDPATIADIYRASDLFVMPSIAESFGMMAVEALACGTPVVCLEDTALPETVASPEIGAAAPRNDPLALAAAIADLLDAPEDRRRRAEAGVALARREYGLDMHAERLAALYRDSLRRWRERREKP